MYNSFTMLVEQLANISSNKEFNPITKEEYKSFCEEYLFEILKGKSFGEFFVEKFSCSDVVLSIYRDDELAKKHIISSGYVK